MPPGCTPSSCLYPPHRPSPSTGVCVCVCVCVCVRVRVRVFEEENVFLVCGEVCL